MAKFYGIIGYAQQVETKPGIWVEDITERYYKGDLLQTNRRLQSTEHLNDDISFSNEISIVADPFAKSNLHNIRYVGFLGTKWKVTNVNVQYPRLILSLGGIYNG